ncbi:MAG: GxxExxY protein [Phycisphaerae bacterium]|nr:GxxExxY protein [Phycisphaerae bacterium]
MLYEELTEKIIGAAYNVYDKMGYGYLESVYEKCMKIELDKVGLYCEFQYPIKVSYDGHEVGNFIADIIVNDMIIVELKSAIAVHKSHEVQLVNYLVSTGKKIGLLINFGPEKVEIKRKHKSVCM